MCENASISFLFQKFPFISDINDFLSYLSLIGSIDQSVLKELPPELLAEIESTMPLCERVKMNKRKRSTVNEKPKYAEISSDEDNDSDEAFECKYPINLLLR